VKSDLSKGDKDPEGVGEEEWVLEANNNKTIDNQLITPVAVLVLGSAISKPPGFTTPVSRVGSRTPASTSNHVLHQYLKMLLMEKEERKEQHIIE
jgi:glycerol dehydrogenase-like iron-containing ADH family enzyme